MLKALGYMSESDARKGVDGMDPKDGNRAFNEIDEARQFIHQEDYASAKKILVALLKQIPTNASARNLLAMCELKLGNLDVVEELYLQSLAHEPRQPELIGQLGRFRLLEGKQEAARARFIQAIEVDPADPAPYLQYGDQYFREGDFAQAQTWYEKALQAQPDNFAAAMQAGTSAMNLGDRSKAEGYFARANRIDPSSWKPF